MSGGTNEDPDFGLLADGSRPAAPEALFARLEELDIAAESYRHPPVFTVEEAKALRGTLNGIHIKNTMAPPDLWIRWPMSRTGFDTFRTSQRAGHGQIDQAAVLLEDP